MREENPNIVMLMLTEFYELSKTDIEIQINKNYDALKNLNNNSKNGKSIKETEIEVMIEKFYLSLSNYFSKNTGSDFTYDNVNYSSVNTFKKNYIKFLKYSEQHEKKVTS